MKKILLILILIFSSQSVFAEMVLFGEAQYNVEKARNEVQQYIQPKINFLLIKPHLVDFNREKNLKALLCGQVELKDRDLALFSIGTYGVVYKHDKLHAYYYSSSGILEYIDIRSSENYPYKSYQYDVNGNLVNMGLRVSKKEAYIYSPKGNLIAHWIGSNGYDEKGRIIMTRKFIE